MRFIREGKGHQDRINDLDVLAHHYEVNAAKLAGDLNRYKLSLQVW